MDRSPRPEPSLSSVSRPGDPGLPAAEAPGSTPVERPLRWTAIDNHRGRRTTGPLLSTPPEPRTEEALAPQPAPDEPVASPLLSVHRGTEVPIREQLAVQLLADLRAGRWRDGERLPSARVLSGRLGVHRSTVRAAYHDLAGAGRVEVREGSGTYVVGAGPGDGGRPGALHRWGRPPSPGEKPDDARPLRQLLRRARRQGLRASELAAAMERWAAAVPGPITVIGREPELTRIWAAEVREALQPPGRTVAGLSLDRDRVVSDRLAEGLVLVDPASHPRASRLAAPWVEVLKLRSGPAPDVRRLLHRTPRGTVIAAISRSPELLGELRALAAGLRGGEVAMAAVDPRDRSRLRRKLRVARFVLADVTCRRVVTDLSSGVRVRTLRHLAADDMAGLARWLDAAPRRRGPAPPGPTAPLSRAERRDHQ